MQYRQLSKVMCSTDSSVRYCAVQFGGKLVVEVPRGRVTGGGGGHLLYTALHSTAVCCNVLQRAALKGTVLYCTKLNYIAVYCTVLKPNFMHWALFHRFWCSSVTRTVKNGPLQ